MSTEALFLRKGEDLVPTSFATGSWDPNIVHGAAIAALFAGRLAPGHEWNLARLTIDIMAPVPMEPLRLALHDDGGGRRATRRSAELSCGGRVVAAARAVLIRRTEVELPEGVVVHPSPFVPEQAPPLDEPHVEAVEIVGFDSFDSRSVVMEWMKVPGDRRPHQWLGLAVPVVDDSELLGVEVAAVAADYAQTAVHRVLPFAEWSFRNAELTMHLAREPVGDWIGVRSESLLATGGAGFNTADLFDRGGYVARSAASLVVEPRRS